MPMTFRERARWAARMALLLFVLTSVAFLSALVAMRFAIQGRDVDMPDVTGKSVIQATQILEGRRLGISVEDRSYSPLPVDAVLRQSPMARTRVKVGQEAHVVLSLGPQKANIPALEGDSLRAARIELLRDSLQLGEVTTIHLPGANEGDETVVKQDPPASATGITSPQVNLLVSLGAPAPSYAMPELFGLPFEEAQARLAASGLRAAKITLLANVGSTHGTVIAQKPSRGERVDANTMIELQIAE
jgi:eukaryotic-like serine/threonine-protein kinase